MSEAIAVRIVDPQHPHTGETGTIAVVDDQVTLHRLPGQLQADMVEIKLTACPHGSTGCFAKQSQLALITNIAGGKR